MEWVQIAEALTALGIPEARHEDIKRLADEVAMAADDERIARRAHGRLTSFLRDRRSEAQREARQANRAVEAATDIQRLGDTQTALRDVRTERIRQQREEGYGLDHDDSHSVDEWTGLLDDYVRLAEAAGNAREAQAYRHRLVQIGALAVAAVESLDRAIETEAFVGYVEPEPEPEPEPAPPQPMTEREFIPQGRGPGDLIGGAV